MKILGFLTKWLFILCLPPLLLTASIALAVNSQGLYEYGFDKYDIRQATGLDNTELSKAARGLIRYFNSDEAEISVTVTKDDQPFPLFNEREIGHLRDVKDLFRLNYLVMGITLIYSLGYAITQLLRKKNVHQLARDVLGGSGVTLALILLLGLLAALDFRQFFLQFHLISFANDLWLLDPSRDYLLMLFPSGFWLDATILCALLTAAGALVLGAASWAHLRYHRPSRVNKGNNQ